MSEWLALHSIELSFGFVWGVICSLHPRFWRRFLLSGGIVLATYFLMVRSVAHAGFSWDNETAALGLLGALLGCLVRPALDLLYRLPKRSRAKQS